MYLSSPFSLLALLIVHIIHVHTTADLIFTISMLGTYLTVRNIADCRTGASGRR